MLLIVPHLLPFETEEGEKIPFYVIEETMVAGVNYLLVSDSEDEETEAYIMREVTTKDDEAVYEMVEDEGQLEALSPLSQKGIFSPSSVSNVIKSVSAILSVSPFLRTHK